MTEKRSEGSIIDSIRIAYFPRGLRDCADRKLAKLHIDWWIEKIRARLEGACGCGEGEEEEPAPSPYYCLWEAVPEHGPGCIQEVCYDERGREISRGPVQCPPVP